MKCLVLVICVIATAYGVSEDFENEALAQLSELTEKCVKESGATEADMIELIQKKYSTRREGKCLQACVMKQIGMMKNGVLDKEGAFKMLEPLKKDDPDVYAKILPIVNKVIDEMATVEEKDECEYAAKLNACVLKTEDELGVHFDEIIG